MPHLIQYVGSNVCVWRDSLKHIAFIKSSLQATLQLLRQVVWVGHLQCGDCAIKGLQNGRELSSTQIHAVISFISFHSLASHLIVHGKFTLMLR